MPERSLGLALYNRGYDVWLGNSRGNVFSTNHTHLSPHSKAFWNYTFEDMALHDDPANIAYVANATGRTMTFVGWSQGNTQFLIASQNATTASVLSQHVNLLIGLAPVSYLRHSPVASLPSRTPSLAYLKALERDGHHAHHFVRLAFQALNRNVSNERNALAFVRCEPQALEQSAHQHDG